MIRLLIAFTALIFLTTGCGVLIGDLPCCGPATATPAPVLPPRDQPKPPVQGTLPPRPSLPAKPSDALSSLPRPTETRAAPTATTAPSPKVVAPPQSAGAANTYWVANPTSGARLFVRVLHPKNWDGKSKLPALVLVPGGLLSSESFTDPPGHGQMIADGGFTIVIFDADGRGQSAGTENYNGHTHQDGLAAAIRFTATLPETDSKKMGLVSQSFGVTMATGVLARYPDLPIHFLIDWEGPANREDTSMGCKGGAGQIRWPPCNDNAFWSEREAVTFIAKLRVPYQRIQSEINHAQPEVTQAVELINAAIAGGVPWTRLNDYPPNQKYDPKAPPAMFPESMDRQREQLIVKYAQELMNK